MRVLRGHPSGWDADPGRSSVTIGVFDGIHLGHRSLIRRLDPSLIRTVLIFDPHPVEVLRPGTHPRLLTTVEERIGLLEAAGVDQVGVLNLNDVRELEAERFVDQVLVAGLHVAQVVCGPDFRFGKDRAGDQVLLAAMADEGGFKLDSAPLVPASDGSAVSSSAIRRLVEEGQIETANRLLGSRFQVNGVVEHGDRRGRELGVPTANLRVPERKVVPAVGVYAGVARWKGRGYPAAINLGFRPTFGVGDLLLEAHLLDFSEDLYGESLRVELDTYLRPELRFDSVEALVEQMTDDIADTRRLIK